MEGSGDEEGGADNWALRGRAAASSSFGNIFREELGESCRVDSEPVDSWGGGTHVCGFGGWLDDDDDDDDDNNDDDGDGEEAMADYARYSKGAFRWRNPDDGGGVE